MKWINISEKLPTNEEFGNMFLCCVETPSNYNYEVAEWFNPINENGNTSHEMSLEPEFLIKVMPYKTKVIAYIKIEEYDEMD